MGTSSLDRSHFTASLASVYDWLNGTGSYTTAADVSATGSITFSANPANNSTIALGGTTVTFVTSGATGNQVNIGANLAATMTALATFANASADANVSKCSSVATSTGVTITYKTGGTAGNSFTLAASAGTVSGATLTGGVSNALTAGYKHYESAYTTSGSGKAEKVNVGTSPACQIGQRKLFTLAAKGAAGDSVVFDFGSFSYGAKTVNSVVLTNVGDYVYAEWYGYRWEVKSFAAGVVSAT